MGRQIWMLRSWEATRCISAAGDDSRPGRAGGCRVDRGQSWAPAALEGPQQAASCSSDPLCLARFASPHCPTLLLCPCSNALEDPWVEASEDMFTRSVSPEKVRAAYFGAISGLMAMEVCGLCTF